MFIFFNVLLPTCVSNTTYKMSSKEDQALRKVLTVEKGYGAIRFVYSVA